MSSLTFSEFRTGEQMALERPADLLRDGSDECTSRVLADIGDRHARPAPSRTKSRDGHGPGGRGCAGKNFWKQERANHHGSFQRLPVPFLRIILRADPPPLVGTGWLCRCGQSVLGASRLPSSDARLFASAARWANAAAKIGKFQDVDARAVRQPERLGRGRQYREVCGGRDEPRGFQACRKKLDGRMRSRRRPHARWMPISPRTRSWASRFRCRPRPTFVIFYKGQKYPASSGIVTYPILKQFFDSLLSQ